jgi:hypothetical protein
LAPSRFGLARKYHNIVVVDPSCSIIGPVCEEASVYRMDRLVKEIRNAEVSALDILKIISAETLHNFAAAMVACHVPLAAQPEKAQRPVRVDIQRERCKTCGGLLTSAEVRFCRMKCGDFLGQLLCRKCQGYLPKDRLTAKTPEEGVAGRREAAWCVACGEDVDERIVGFCRLNSAKFDGAILCRSCQRSLPRSRTRLSTVSKD